MTVRRFVFIVFFAPLLAFAQQSSLRVQQIAYTADTIQLDTLSIYPNSFHVYCGQNELPPEAYYLNHSASRFRLLQPCSDSIRVVFRVLPMNLAAIYKSRDTSVIYTPQKGLLEQYLYHEEFQESDIYGSSSISKSGSISRGVTFGTNQNLSVNSTLNLELAGDLTPNLKVLASVSDNNLSIQAEGNTNQLKEFDQMFIQIYNDRLKIIAGDFWLYKPKGYFLTYKKKAQGLTLNYQWKGANEGTWNTQVSGALSKGKFNRQIITGVEGNQGPYRLAGSENETYIIILSGTERIYLNGKLLERGQDFDYIINYNTGELTFTARNLITKDSRIVAEFQYSDQNYSRSLIQSSTTYTSKKTEFWINTYTEQDAKNQPVQQDLSDSQKSLLASIGDSLNQARVSSIDSIGYTEYQNLYKMIDSLGYDSVLVYSVQEDSALYSATFTYVGSGNGDYNLSTYTALGKVYVWVQPAGGISQGSYAPSTVLVTPKKKQVISSGISYRLTKNLIAETELAYSTYDQNTFSRLDDQNNNGYANRTKLTGNMPLGHDSIPRWNLELKGELEVLDKNFTPIEQYRAVEFDRDWNTRNKGYTGNQIASTISADFKNLRHGNIAISGQNYQIGTAYNGLKGSSTGQWKNNGFAANWTVSYLQSSGTTSSEFFRHKLDISQNIGKLKIGYVDDHERNNYRSGTIPLDLSSYQFFDYQFYISSGDSIKNSYKLFFRERRDRLSDSTLLVPTAIAQTAGGEINIISVKNQTLNIVTSYRQLKILDSTLLSQTPENSILGRIDYELKAFRGALNWSTFYEAGSGLELKKEFVYVKVSDGQGIYTWIDYNSDGVKDLNEFEVAQYADQASYIRVYTTTTQYTKTYYNEFNQSVYWRSERLWASKKGFLKMLSRFSDQARIRINRKTNVFDGATAFNPFQTEIRDTSLLSSSTNIRNTVFFNRTSNVFGIDYTLQKQNSKTLLASGFDSRANNYQEIDMRWNIMKKFSLENKFQTGTKDAEADYTTGRNYALIYFTLEPSFIYQPTTTFRITLDGRYSEKRNSEENGGETAIIRQIGSTFKFNQAEKGSFQGEIKLIRITFDGTATSTVGYEMLEALKNGVNYTWNFSYQRSMSKNMQISIQYNGRKSEGNRTIHSGGMEVRAFF